MTKTFFRKSNERINPVVVDWLFFGLFLFAPVMTLAVLLYCDYDKWWTVTALLWLFDVGIIGVIFCFLAVRFEVIATYRFIAASLPTDERSFYNVTKQAILTRSRYMYSGKQVTKVVANQCDYTLSAPTLDRKRGQIDWTRKEHRNLWSKMTTSLIFKKFGFQELEEPRMLHQIDDILGYHPLMTKDTWSLERLYCRSKYSRYVAIVEGNAALTRSQRLSSLICTALGVLIVVALGTAFMVWLNLPVVLIIIGILLLLSSSWSTIMSVRRVGKLTRRIKNYESGPYHHSRPVGEERSPKDSNGDLASKPNRGVFLMARDDEISQAPDLLEGIFDD